MSEISFELAKSNRSACKTCKGKIDKGKIRVGIHNTVDDRTMT